MSVDLDEVRRTLGEPGPANRAAWEQIRGLLLERVGESTFEIWLGALRVIAVDAGGALVLDGPDGARDWVRRRFWRVIEFCVKQAGSTVRLASEAQAVAVSAR